MWERAQAIGALLALAACGGEEQDPISDVDLERIRAIREATANEWWSEAQRLTRSPAMAARLWQEYVADAGSDARDRWLFAIGQQGGEAAALVDELAAVAAREESDMATSAVVSVLRQARGEDVPPGWREFARLARHVHRVDETADGAPAPELVDDIGVLLGSGDLARRRIAWRLLASCSWSPVWSPRWQPRLEAALDDDDELVVDAARSVALRTESGPRSEHLAEWLADEQRGEEIVRWLARDLRVFLPIGWLPLERFDPVFRTLAEHRPVLDRVFTNSGTPVRLGLLAIYAKLAPWCDVTEAFERALDDPELVPMAVLCATPWAIAPEQLRATVLRLADDPEHRGTAVYYLTLHAAADAEVALALASIVTGEDADVRDRADSLLQGRPRDAHAVFDAYVERTRDGVDAESTLGAFLAASFAGASLAEVPGLDVVAERAITGGEDEGVRARAAAVLGRIALEREDEAAMGRALDAFDPELEFAFLFADELPLYVETMVELADRLGGPTLTEWLREAWERDTRLPEERTVVWDVDLERVRDARLALAAWRRAVLGH